MTKVKYLTPKERELLAEKEALLAIEKIEKKYKVQMFPYFKEVIAV